MLVGLFINRIVFDFSILLKKIFSIMAENYTVNYTIKVTDQASRIINAFQTSTQSLVTAQGNLDAFAKKLTETMTLFQKVGKTTPRVNFSCAEANRKLDRIIAKLTKINELAATARTITINTGTTKGGKGSGVNKGGGSTTNVVGGGGGNNQPAPKTPKTPTPKTTRVVKTKSVLDQRNLAYKALGPAMIDSGGIGALDMIKGMGVAYGITGLGVLMSKAMKDATEYNNLITTTRNILQAHDTRDNFSQRFAGMERVIRNVGIETKFSAPEVADASKFLAMAGFKLEDITKAIRPIADIALVGDSELGETADVVTNIMTGYGIDPGNVRHAADIMTQTFTMSNTTLMEIAESYKYAASLLSAGGVSFEEATAGIGILGNAGIKGSQAGTTMRTIMANIVNPTKKQAAVWEKLGIKRFDEKGDLRDLVDIFADLNRAGLSVDKIYQMFHRTAAQGAVALIKNVDEWNRIVQENFLSEGITAELADAKKNTIQGLWAQLTSMFTENGMKAFESLDGQIRQMLKETIDWLHTDEASELVKSLGQTLLDLIKMLKDFTMMLMDLYKRFSPFIKLWLELQLKFSAILIPLRIFRALFNFGALIVSNVRSLGVMITQFNSLTKAVKGLTGLRGALASTWSTMGRIGGNPTGAGVIGGLMGNPKLKTAAPEVVARYTQMQRYRANQAIGVYTGGIGGMAGAMMGGYFGSQLGDEGSTTSMMGAIGGSVAGMAVGSLIGSHVAPWLATTAVPFLLTNPVGWGILVAGGLAAGVASFISYQNAVEEANAANQKFLASTASINGISLSEHATQADKYLSLVYNKQMDVNRVIGEHINLMREQLGIMDEASKKLSDKTLGETHQTEIENAQKPFKGFWSSESNQKDAATAGTYLPDGSIDFQLLPRLQDVLTNNGSFRKWTFNDRLFDDSKYGYQQLAAARFLAALGRDMSEGSDLQKLQQSYNKRFLMSESLDDFNAIWADTRNAFIKSYLSESVNWRINDLDSKPESEWKRSYDYVYMHNKMLQDMFAWDRPNASANAQMLNDLVEILRQLANGDVQEDILKKFMLHSGIPIFDEGKFGQFGTDAFMKQFGWYNNQWNAGSYQFFNVDTGKMETINVTANEARQAFLLFHQQIIDLTNRLNPKLRTYFNSFLDNPVWNYGGTNNGANGKATLNGKEWKWNPVDRLWHGPAPYAPIDNAEMQRRLSQTANAGGGGSVGNPGARTGAGNRGNGGGRGPKASDYKNHYNTGNAAPKQVIVRIDKLMNVESVDLSNPDNAAVIANLKSELTQALVDVVHDFDETWNG